MQYFEDSPECLDIDFRHVISVLITSMRFQRYMLVSSYSVAMEYADHDAELIYDEKKIFPLLAGY